MVDCLLWQDTQWYDQREEIEKQKVLGRDMGSSPLVCAGRLIQESLKSCGPLIPDHGHETKLAKAVDKVTEPTPSQPVHGASPLRLEEVPDDDKFTKMASKGLPWILEEY